MSAPPPPPPHGEVPRSSGLPPGKYDIFVIPQHSAGSGFLYLPSMRPNINSFFAGFASALILVALFQSMAPAFRVWWQSFQGLGNMGITLLILGVGFGAWALGRTQKDGPSPSSSYHQSSYSSYNNGGGAAGNTPGGFGASASGSSTDGGTQGESRPRPPPHSSPPPPPPPGGGGARPPPQSRAHSPQPEKPKTSSWQRSTPQTETPKPQAPKGSWEKAREETRKKEEERKAKEAEQKRREEAAKRLAELRAREAKERQEREKDRERKEKETRDKRLKEEAEQRRKELAEKLKREREHKQKEEEQKKSDAATATATTTPPLSTAPGDGAGATRVGSSYAFSGVGERTSMWPNGRPPTVTPSSSPTKKAAAEAGKKPPSPTARTYVSAGDEEAHSFRPYDQPKPSRRRPSVSSFTGSDTSWAQSHTTSQTSPPPSVRGPYTTKDPDKIVIQAVYLFMNQYAKTPASQLVSGVGSVTDGLILRITTEGLFIDDDVRGVPQREWDVKAWTLKLVEIWCPPHCLNSSASSAAAAAASSNPSSGPKSAPHVFYKMPTGRRNADRDSHKVMTGDDANAYLTEMLRACKDCCRLGLCERTFKNTNIQSSTGQTGVWKSKGLHILRATVRDQEGKRYMFVMSEMESWKLAFGLQRLRGGTQVRQLGVAGMTPSEARGTLEMLGWGG